MYPVHAGEQDAILWDRPAYVYTLEGDSLLYASIRNSDIHRAKGGILTLFPYQYTFLCASEDNQAVYFLVLQSANGHRYLLLHEKSMPAYRTHYAMITEEHLARIRPDLCQLAHSLPHPGGSVPPPLSIPALEWDVLDGMLDDSLEILPSSNLPEIDIISAAQKRPLDSGGVFHSLMWYLFLRPHIDEEDEGGVRSKRGRLDPQQDLPRATLQACELTERLGTGSQLELPLGDQPNSLKSVGVDTAETRDIDNSGLLADVVNPSRGQINEGDDSPSEAPSDDLHHQEAVISNKASL
jgi:hypothetical protein